jgi:TonB family protein
MVGKMMKLAWLILVLAVSSAEAESRDSVRGEVVSALAKGDTARLKRLVKLPLKASGLWFDSAKCKGFAGRDVVVDAAAFARFVGCIKELGLREPIGPNRYVHAIYGPGVPVYLLIESSEKPRWVGVMGPRAAVGGGDGVVPLEPAVFGANVTGFSREVVPDAALRAKLDAGTTAVSTTLQICVDAKGAIEKVSVTTSAAEPGFDQLASKAAKAWQVKPFELRGKPVRACTLVNLGYPKQWLKPDIVVEAPPPPPPPGPPGTPTGAPNVSPTVIEPLRKSGEKNLRPPAETVEQMKADGKTKIVGSFKMCLSTAGTVSMVDVLKSTGYSEYDTLIRLAMVDWTYRPYEVKGKPSPVCTAVTFLYSVK